MKPKGKIRWGAVLNYAVGISAIVAAAEGVVSPKVAAGALLLTKTLALFQKPAVRTEAER